MAENTTTEWCAGLPLVRQRPFAPEEQEYLQRLAHRLRLRGILAVLSYPLLICCIGLLTWVTTSSINQTEEAMKISGLLLLIVCLPMQLLVVRDAFGRRKSVLGDLHGGCVKQFAGTMPPDLDTDKTLVKLRQARLVPKIALGQWSLELLPTSRRVWRVQEQRVKPWLVVNVVEVAQTPEMAAIAAQWLQPVAWEGEKTLLSGRRELSPAERDELQKYARRLWMRPLPIAIVLTLWASLLMISQNVKGGVDRGGFTLVVFSAVCADLVLLGAVQFTQKLRQDAQRGHVLIVGVENKAAPVSTQASLNNASAIREILPQSQRQWTCAGQPAAWRTTSPSILKSDSLSDSKK